ncbi:MAG: transcriptional regulator [Nitrososphaeria archaeon]
MSHDEEDEDLISKVYRLILSSGEGGLLQSELWKKLDLTSRDGSRIATKLEKRRLIVREKMLQNGRWTYKLVPLVIPIDTSSVEGLPCLTCPYEDKCEPGGQVSPENCRLLERWLLDKYHEHLGENEGGQ